MAKKRKRASGFGAGEHRPRVHIKGRTFKLGTRSPYKGRSWVANPYLREVGMFSSNPRRHRRHHRRNPGGLSSGAVGALKGVIHNPMSTVTSGLYGLLAAYLTISLPNWLLPFPGISFTDKLLRAATRVAAGGLLIGFFKHPAVATGASIGAIGSTVFDFLGTRVIIGAGDTGQTPLALLSPLTSIVAPTGAGSYVRQQLGSYTRQQFRPGLREAPALRAEARFPAMAVTAAGKHRLW